MTFEIKRPKHDTVTPIIWQDTLVQPQFFNFMIIFNQPFPIFFFHYFSNYNLFIFF